MRIKLLCVAGARPNFMKLAPLIKNLRSDLDFHSVLVHTGQHYDDKMSGQFFRDLALPAPDHYLGIGSGSHAQQTAEIMKAFEPVLLREKPRAVVVVGDVNSTLACALVAVKLGVDVVHVEAGLRSFDRDMPEEINRVVTDAVSSVLLITEASARHNLLAEGIDPTRIHMVGNLMIDSLRSHLEIARKSEVLDRLRIADSPFGLVTLHRPSNVDDLDRLGEICDALHTISRTIPLYFPVHPRTKARMETARLPLNGQLRLVEPLGYLDFLCLMAKSSIVLTDSGGIQEETTALGVPCLTLRTNTERPITVELGTNVLAGTRKDEILRAWERMRKAPKLGRIPPYWDGCAADRCREALRSVFAPARTNSRAHASMTTSE